MSHLCYCLNNIQKNHRDRTRGGKTFFSPCAQYILASYLVQWRFECRRKNQYCYLFCGLWQTLCEEISVDNLPGSDFIRRIQIGSCRGPDVSGHLPGLSSRSPSSSLFFLVCQVAHGSNEFFTTFTDAANASCQIMANKTRLGFAKRRQENIIISALL